MITLDTKVSELDRIGKSVTFRLKKLSIETVRDLIFYYPFRYDDFSQINQIRDLRVGMTTTVCGQIETIVNRRSPKKRKSITEAIIRDSSDFIRVVWFNQPWLIKNIKSGDELRLSGKIAGNFSDIYFNSPTYEKLGSQNINTGRLVPIYPLTDGISQKQIRFFVKAVIDLSSGINDFLPIEIVRKEGFYSLAQALEEIHFPQNGQSLKKARERLAFNELFLIQLWSQSIKNKLKEKPSYKIKFHKKKTKKFIDALKFELTTDQKRSAWEIIQDLGKVVPMNRLLEGDVGTGKTVVAAIAILNVFLSGYQSVIMTPTEILARQHFSTFIGLFRDQDIRIGLFTRSQVFIDEKKVTKKEFLKECKDGKIDLIVGTHTLIGEKTKFNKLAFVVIDEQHRFGVIQRQQLKEKSKKISHFLSLTATPIPRSLALTIYGDLDISIIKTQPSGRKKIITKIVESEKRNLAYDFISKQIKSGRQVYVVCPLIDPSDKLGTRSVKQEFEKLDREVFPDLKIGLLHGKLKSIEKEKVIDDFLKNEINILVSTSVVEVGIDVVNATVMMIEGSERFGLAQLHQFRGRVGRGEYQSYCFLFSDNSNQETKDRLNALADCHDGFELAQKDLKFRGAGQIYGYQQSGLGNLKIASLDDLELAQKARDIAINFLDNKILSNYPDLIVALESVGFSDHLE